jgi:hydrogenase maturation factor
MSTEILARDILPGNMLCTMEEWKSLQAIKQGAIKLEQENKLLKARLASKTKELEMERDFRRKLGQKIIEGMT